MKEIKKITTIPEHTQEHSVYICENCGKEHTTLSNIFKCEICGREICSNCHEYVSTHKDTVLFTKEDGIICMFDEEEASPYDVRHHLCRECSNKIWTDHDYKYVDAVNKLVYNFNNEIGKLNKKYLRGDFGKEK